MTHATHTIYFDGTCGLCSAGERRFARVLERRGYRLVPLQDPEAVARFGDPPAESSGEVKLRTTDGRTLGGADAVVEISRSIWWAWPLYAIGKLPGAMYVLRALYRIVARSRMRVSRVCKLEPKLRTNR
jgi:predicted DCC family thiol-disulfide oxidoreductase YuxK